MCFCCQQEERKRLLADREQLEALCEGLKRSLHGSSWVIASIDDRARQTIAGLDKVRGMAVHAKYRYHVRQLSPSTAFSKGQ